MKKFIKILVIAIAALLLLGILLPFVFKGKIIELAKREINKSVNAKVEFSGISLGFLRSFPDFSLGVKDLSITGAGLFEGDTLAYIKNVRVTIDLRSVFSSGGYEIKKIGVYTPVLHIKTLADGTSNYDIALPSSDTLVSPSPADTTPGFELHLKKLEIKDGRISYHDHSMNLFFAAGNLEHTLRGNLSGKASILETETTISGLNLTYEGIPYLKQAKLHYVAGIDADMVNSMYTMRDNEMTLNHLFIRFAGSVGLSEDDININLTFSSPKNEFKHLLSLIPALYMKDFEGIRTDGIVDLHGKVDGVYNEENLPSFEVYLAVQNGSFGYPDLPGKVTDISIKASIFNPGGDADNTIIDVPEFSMMMNNAPVQMKMNLKTPVSDPDIHLVMKAFFDLATLKDIYPMDETDDLSGKINADFTLAARVSQFENEKYEEINAEGFVSVTDLTYYTDYIGQKVAIKEIALSLSPAFVQLTNLDMNIGNSDLKATGSLSNYLAYGLSDGTLKGNLVVHSDFIDVSALLPDETGEEGAVAGETAEPETSAGNVVQIPENVDFSMVSSFRKLLYDGIEMENVKGELIAKEGTLLIKDFTMDILDGKMGMKGSYSAKDPDAPAVDFDIDLTNVDIQKTYNTFALVSKYLPLAEKTNGKVNIRVAFNTLLDNKMMPVYESLSGEGRFTSAMIKISNVNTLNKIGDLLKFEKIKSMDINKIMFDFKFIDGKVIVEPFDFAFETIKGVLGGSTALDESIDYVMTLNIPRKEFGSAANNVINGLVGELGKLGVDYTPSETVGLNVLIGGLLSDPEVKVSLKETGKSLVDDLQTKIKEEITQKVQEVSKELKEKAQKIIDEADKRANALIAEAEKQAASVRQNAQTAAARVLEESEKQAANVEDEGKKKGMIAAAVAKESAKVIREEGKSNADKILQEGDNQADAIVSKVRSEVETIRKNARNDAEKILNP